MQMINKFMKKILLHQDNVNQSRDEISPHSSQNGPSQKGFKNVTNVDKDAEKQEVLITALKEM